MRNPYREELERQNLAFARAMLRECHHPTDHSLADKIGVRIQSREFRPAPFEATLARVHRVVTSKMIPIQPEYTSVKDCIAKVTEAYGVSYEEIKSRSGQQPISLARQATWHAMSRGLGLSQARIAWIFDRERSTVSYGIKAHAERYGLPL